MKRGKLKKSLVYTAIATMVVGAFPQVNFAAEPSNDGYQLVWAEEFNGDALNTNDWNVEQHEPGWVNQELQRYTALDEGNIQVGGGHLAIRPHVEGGENTGALSASVEKTEIALDVNVGAERATSSTILLQANFGKIDDAAHPEAAAAAATVKIYDISLKEVFADGTESEELLQNAGMDSEANWYFGVTAPGAGSIRYEDGAAVIRIDNAGEANWNIQLQQSGITLESGHNYKVRMSAESDVNRSVELSVMNHPDDNTWDWYNGCTSVIAGTATGSVDRVITSGRITTQGKHDFTYGRFEARAKVPTGQGYLPAFWLMATDESLYGQWPKCGEIDIMEVMGQNTSKSYHTIHYGYNSGNGHKENQGTKVLDSSSFADDYHIFRMDWEPGVITWYVDDVEVYSTRDWYTGQDDDNQITYPAPFDQNFYVILNLAVGGSWVGYPTDEVYADMNNQEFDVDYVRVYQKSAEEYAAAEAVATRPEAAPVTYREADESGNYVINGDFAQDIAFDGAAGASDDNWKLHLESDAEGTTYTVANNAIRMVPSAVGGQNHSVQLKQANIPMYKGWEYELTFDAVADEERDIVIDVEGPDHGWIRYMQDATVHVGTTQQSYRYTFTMNEKTDPNGSLEFNLGKQGSTAPVTISNVKLVHKSGTEIAEDNSKVIRPDGNYIYNGFFDMGQNRLGYWEFSDEDASNIRVTNRGNVRELQVVVPEGKTVRIAQSELAPIIAGDYEISFDGYTAEGTDADGLKVNVGGKVFTPSLTANKAHFSKKLTFQTGLDRDASNVVLEFSKPGTYYVDNVFLCESALIKNGSFNAGLSGFSPYINEAVTASYVVDSMNGNDNTFAITIDDTVADDNGNNWYIQLNQDGVPLEQGKQYRLSFRAKSSIERKISVIMQQFEGEWANYSGNGPVEIGPEWQTFTVDFAMEHPTDLSSRFNITMGSVDGVRISQRHDVFIDDISLIEVENEEEPETPAPAPAPTEEPATVEPAPTVTPAPVEEKQPEVTPAEEVKPEPEVKPAPEVKQEAEAQPVVEEKQEAETKPAPEVKSESETKAESVAQPVPVGNPTASPALQPAAAPAVTPAPVAERTPATPVRPRRPRTTETKPVETAKAETENSAEESSEEQPETKVSESAAVVAQTEENDSPTENVTTKKSEKKGFFAAVAKFFASIFKAILGWFK